MYFTSLKTTGAVTDGFLPAAKALGREVTILTDRPGDYAACGVEVFGCDVRDPRAVIDTIAHHEPPEAVFTNSDHIQAETAMVADYFGLPGKDWRACATAKNKALMRRALARAGVESVWSARLSPGDPVPADTPLPAVVKPREGVASEHVVYVETQRELAEAVRTIRAERPGEALVVEQYLSGPLHTLETLGDSRTGAPRVLGGFRTTLGPLPYFVEERLDWHPEGPHEHVLAALRALGVGFGACHTEYVVTESGPRIIEINYRVIGDDCEFLLADLLGVPLFEWILRVHLGEELPTAPPAPSVYGSAVSLVADRAGHVTSAPPPLDGGHDGRVRLWHRPLRAVGDRVEHTHTNRDYLGLLRVIGADHAEVEAAVTAFRAERPWVIA
ncbi:ATP-grasp domain-containing protein [Sinosporangium siamense]|uniref:Carboxylate--amine ligase n=1 Tax=Sinosporangium siamense TaxID=1367973 RepID=A0A919RGP1_9ACTN|nr:ATP-grasp domain-containing protein [Sinosporangium siamense]GII93042.1 carboxylate--amine ligase [Sinosporangium siamense]